VSARRRLCMPVTYVPEGVWCGATMLSRAFDQVQGYGNTHLLPDPHSQCHCCVAQGVVTFHVDTNYI